MKRARWAILAITALVLGTIVAPPAAAVPSPPGGNDGVHVYTGELTSQQMDTLLKSGVDREEMRLGKSADGKKVVVEAILGEAQAEELRKAGLGLKEQPLAADKDKRVAAKGDGVYKPYSGAGGIREQIVKAANGKPGIAKVVDIGTTVGGQPLTAIKVTKDARQLRDGTRKAVLYMAAQHAREWITPEMTRRLLLHFLNGYGTNPEITQLVNTTELWFIPVSNPDGYDHTFTGDNRLWRKNMRDNNGDGQITSGDGVDLNRNFEHKWGYDNEGSSDNPASETYRGASPQSEPETRAVDNLAKKVKFTYLLNYHSAAQLLLYGVGWQQATPSPDDLIFEALLGDDATPAVPGYDPDISAELYTTNGETDGHMSKKYGTLAITPEMGTCESAVASVPDDEWTQADCAGGSGFTFPDSEALIQAEFAKNIPLAIDLAKSVKTPENPVSPVGRTVPDFKPDTFTVSYGDPQPVAVVARRSLSTKQMRFRINGGPVRLRGLTEWNGGERYGDENDEYFAEYRAKVEGARPGDRVEVWFAGFKSGTGTVESKHFTYKLEKKSNAKVLVVANEDYTGFNPDYPASVTAPKYAAQYRQALQSAGYSSETWDVDAQGVPHHLGVLGHFKAVAWYLGDDRLAMDAQDVVTQTPFGPLPDMDVKRSQQDLTIAVRDYLNEGGKLLHTGETAAYYGFFGTSLGGIYYGLDGAPDADCVITSQDGFFEECLILADDFAQYYLGVNGRNPRSGPTGFAGTGTGLNGASGTFGGPATVANPLDEAGSLQVTSDTLPPARFPQFKSSASATYVGGNGPFDPVEGNWYVAGGHTDDAYMRLTRTVDLAAVPAAQRPRLEFQLSYDTEEGYDNVIVEAHTAGQDNWTTLPDLNGGTGTTVPAECEAGFLLEEHPWLLHYLTPGATCAATGTSGSWNSFTGNSGGWQQVAFDLSAYAGQRVEVSISYVTDPGTGGVGAFVDDTRVTTTGGAPDAEGFESGLGVWAIPGPPTGSPAGAGDFARAQADKTAAVSTKDSVFLGFGLEQVASAAERAATIKKIMKHLIG
ncbi:M14 family metallopeptidase [Streptosporangium sp. 'caverna']|uniref:M14 family metallopeptidase n=1 Tax=Streptosporangium sp. 'caverna' TaxID=2202249 RepID=UPI000D7E9323|nr:M14 family metallopeptidase [Streptosporangium sp. 'caverna']AWS46254.1 zinc carboxypeptidase [Streptosporangium sp. 'caverna']